MSVVVHLLINIHPFLYLTEDRATEIFSLAKKNNISKIDHLYRVIKKLNIIDKIVHNGEPKEDSGCKDEPFSSQLPTTQNHIKWGEFFDTQQEATKNQENELNATTHTKQESNLTSEDARMQRISL